MSNEDKNRSYEKDCLDRAGFFDIKENKSEVVSFFKYKFSMPGGIGGRPKGRGMKNHTIYSMIGCNKDNFNISIFLKSEFVEVDFGKGEFDVEDENGVIKSYNLVITEI